MEHVVQKSHEADKAVLTEFGRMGPSKLREECKNRGLSISRSKERMISYLACAQAFTRGRNVGLSERPLEELKPKDEEKKQDDVRRACPGCGEDMTPFLGIPGMYVCYDENCRGKGGGGGGCDCEEENESSDEIFRKYTAALRREDKLKGKVGIVMRCSFPDSVSPVELQKLSDRLTDAVYRTTLGIGCGGHGGDAPGAVKIHEVDDRDDKADAMRYGAPQPFTVHLESNNRIPGLKCLLLPHGIYRPTVRRYLRMASLARLMHETLSPSGQAQKCIEQFEREHGKLPPMLLGYVHPKRPWHRFTNKVAEIVFKIRLFLWAKSVMRAHKKWLQQKENATLSPRV